MTDPLLQLTAIVALGVTAQVVAVWLRIPAIILLLAFGVLAGPSVAGLTDPEQLLGDLLSPFVTLAVGVILFEGALALRPRDLTRATGRPVGRLLSLGAAITWAAGTIGCLTLLDLPLNVSLLIGAILIVSGPTVVLPLLEFIRPTPPADSLLRWEGILIDPIGAIVAALVFAAIDAHGFTPGGFVLTVGVGASIGVAGAWLLLVVLRSRRLSTAQDPVATLGMVIAVTGLASVIEDDAGLVAAIAAGLVLATQTSVPIARIVEFKETFGMLLLGILFILLAGLVRPADVVGLGADGLGLVAILVLVARPLGVALCTAGSPLTWRERAVVASMAPRGIVAASTASTFSLLLIDEHVPGAQDILPVTFLVIVCTVVLSAVVTPALSRALGVTVPVRAAAEAAAETAALSTRKSPGPSSGPGGPSRPSA